VIRNGQFNVVDGPAWEPGIQTSSASYNTADPYRLTNVANIVGIEVGALVTGAGVGREVYVTAKNVGAGTLELSQPLYGAAANQSYTFTRFRYVLDFSGFSKLSKFTLSDIEFQCGGFASGILLAPAGQTFHVRDCFMTKPADRGITSHGRGCQDLQIDRCHFVSDEQDQPATARTSTAFNVNANDVKIRDNRFSRFRHTGVLHGNGHLIVGNHWFQGDDEVDSPRLGGMIFTYPNVKSVITGNYVDNSTIEWTNEHDAEPDFGVEYSFGGMAITGNIFTCNDVADWFNWIIVKPFGVGHFIQGLSVQGNTFKSINGSIHRVEGVDDTFAALDFGRSRNIEFSANTFNGVSQATINPVTVQHDQTAVSAGWVLDIGGYLPFGGWARNVTSVVAEGALTNSAGAEIFASPNVTVNYGAASNSALLNWPEPCKGRVVLTARTDNPF
ncbi:MAG: right-handed parallel beta-helix repeat-containing protein, partial [Paracoccaceae bacterium]|nr:right-handed parallel beta-helix repeat-containing protein [Paracoccaceae bacterium]